LHDLWVFDLTGNFPHIEARVVGSGGSGGEHDGWIFGAPMIPAGRSAALIQIKLEPSPGPCGFFDATWPSDEP
jgi:hypothetical protein